MIELNDFYNEGFGWICRHCEKQLAAEEKPLAQHSRIMNEGEAESKQVTMSSRALAKWADAAQRTLFCPRCGISELADIA